MREFKTVLSYTIKERIHKKSFIVTTVLMCLVVVIMFNVPKLVSNMGANANKDILVVDRDNIFEGSLDSLNSMDLGYNFSLYIGDNSISEDDINTKINNKDCVGAIVFSTSGSNVSFDYIVSQNGDSPDVTTFQTVFSQIYHKIEISKLNLSADELSKLTSNITYNVKTTNGEAAPQISAPIIILSILLFFAIYFFAFQVSATITMEKTSKVMETLVTSTKPRFIILGKTIGTGLVGLLQLVIVTIVGIISYKAFAETSATASFLDFSQIKPITLVIAFVYFILGYALYAFLYALVGSTVSKPEDIQGANAPVAMISMFGFYFGYFTMIFSPASSAGTFASLLPISAPFNMPFRMMMTHVPAWQIIASIAILIATIALVIHVSVKIYSAAVLHYGSRMNVKDLLKLYKQK